MKPGEGFISLPAERVERLPRGAVRVARRQHQQPALGLTPNENEAILRRAFSLPSFSAQPLKRRSHNLAEVRARLKAPGVHQTPLKVVNDSKTRCMRGLEGREGVTAHRRIVAAVDGGVYSVFRAG
jgi:hypothetical protein